MLVTDASAWMPRVFAERRLGLSPAPLPPQGGLAGFCILQSVFLCGARAGAGAVRSPAQAFIQIACRSYGLFILAIVFFLLTQALLGVRGWSLTLAGIGGGSRGRAGLDHDRPDAAIPETLLLPGSWTLNHSDVIDLFSLLGWSIFVCAALSCRSSRLHAVPHCPSHLGLLLGDYPGPGNQPVMDCSSPEIYTWGSLFGWPALCWQLMWFLHRACRSIGYSLRRWSNP